MFWVTTFSATATISVKPFSISVGTPSPCLSIALFFALNWLFGLKYLGTRLFPLNNPCPTEWNSEHFCGFSSWHLVCAWEQHLSSILVFSPYNCFTRFTTRCCTLSFISARPWRSHYRPSWSPSCSGLWVPSFLTRNPTGDAILEFDVGGILRVPEVDVLLDFMCSNVYQGLCFEVVDQRAACSHCDTLGSALPSQAWPLLRRTWRTFWDGAIGAGLTLRPRWSRVVSDDRGWHRLDNKSHVSSPLVDPITMLSRSLSSVGDHGLELLCERVHGCCILCRHGYTIAWWAPGPSPPSDVPPNQSSHRGQARRRWWRTSSYSFTPSIQTSSGPWRLGPSDAPSVHERELPLQSWGWSSRRTFTGWATRLVTAVWCFKFWFIALTRLVTKLFCCTCCWVCIPATNW